MKIKKLPAGFYRCKKKGHGIHFSPECSICKTEKDRKEKGLCLATLWHGPGHQSSTYCQVKGPHKVHKAVYGSFEQEMEWKKKKAFTGYFDDPVELGKR